MLVYYVSYLDRIKIRCIMLTLVITSYYMYIYNLQKNECMGYFRSRIFRGVCINITLSNVFGTQSYFFFVSRKLNQNKESIRQFLTSNRHRSNHI